jgi:hypothetical protein
MTPEQASFKARVEIALNAMDASDVIFQEEQFVPTWTFSWGDQGQLWPFKLAAKDWSLTPLPYLIWVQSEPVWGFPHISSDGAICILEREGLDYDPDDIEGIVTELVNRSAAMLAKNHSMSESSRLVDFSNELEAYCHQMNIPRRPLDHPLGANNETYAEVNMTRNKGDIPPLIRVHNGKLDNNRHTNINLKIIDLTVNQLPGLMSNPDDNWWIKFVENLTSDQRKGLLESKSHGALLRVQNQYGGALFVLYWSRKNRENYREIYTLNPAYHNYITRRVGGGSLSKCIAIVGVGAVGSRVAEHLTLAGVLNLTLVDHDEMNVHNLGRHILDRRDVGIKKVKALSDRLSARMPGVNITAKAESLEQWLNTNIANDYDVLVLATGDAPSERAVIRRAWRENWTCKIVSTFVEAGGLGGHAISMQPGHSGCIECLYLNDGSSTGRMRTAFLEPGQTVSLELGGCGPFTPYSSVDSTRTALIAVELALEHEEAGYIRWAGAGKQAAQFELRPSATWYALRESRIKAVLHKTDYLQKDCPCCGV